MSVVAYLSAEESVPGCLWGSASVPVCPSAAGLVPDCLREAASALASRSVSASAREISYATIAKLEKGENVQMDVLDKICVQLKCQLSDIAEIVNN